MKNAACLLIAAVVLSAGCSSVSVTRDYDDSADFSALKTYAWQHAEQPETGIVRLDNDLMDDRIRKAVDAALAGKGFRLVDRAEADFLVAYFVDYKQRITGSSVRFGVGTGSYGRYGGVGYNTAVSDYEEGHLTIDVINPSNGKNFWRGVGRRSTYEGSSPAKMTKVVDSAVSRILSGFPPKQ